MSAHENQENLFKKTEKSLCKGLLNRPSLSSSQKQCDPRKRLAQHSAMQKREVKPQQIRKHASKCKIN